MPAALGELIRGLLCTLADSSHTLAGAPPDLAKRLVRPCADLAYGLSGALAHLPDRLAGTLANLAHGLPGAPAEVLYSPLRTLAEVLYRSAGLVQQVAASATDVFRGAPDTLQQLRIAVERSGDAGENRLDVVEPRLQQRLRLHSLDLQLHPAEPRLDTDTELNQVLHLREHGNLCVKVLDLEIDLVHLHNRDVDQHIHALGDLTGIHDGVVVELPSLS